MDDNLKIMILGTTAAISRIPPKDRTWENVIATFQNNSLIEPDGEEIGRCEFKSVKSKKTFNLGGCSDPDIVSEIETWFKKLIDNNDILNGTQIDLTGHANIVAQSGARVDSSNPFTFLVTMISNEEEHRKTSCDIGILRYPDISHPYFQVYRIRLNARSSCQRFLVFESNANSINGDFVVRKYKPRASVLDSVRKEIRQAAVKEAENLLLSYSGTF
ncbi:hypothetical protein BDN72DRAFT_863695 [Pluteus cervinus]|uniref:Uncharacterized protein n=1 Tax=Pluteus cervinus TaxID=181527 RepID=A0ACD3A7M6_9AGAR|nr:hypothetical protein BDN72DRAFT_863695 [Pluteus cervinus]